MHENCLFLIKWAKEKYGDWSTWMRYTFPGCKTTHETSISIVEDKIIEMQHKNEIKYLSEGWQKITDMLAGSLVCSNNQQVLDTL